MSRKKFKTYLCKLCSEDIGSDSFICTNCNSNFDKLCLFPSQVDPDNWAENNVSFLYKIRISQCGMRSEKLSILKFLKYYTNASTNNFSLVAQNVENILEVYQDIIPTCPSIQVIETPFEYDSIAILKFYHPVMLNNFSLVQFLVTEIVCLEPFQN